MATVKRVIVNELGNTIQIGITQDQHGVTVVASGPHSEVEHTWTPMEAATLRDLFLLLPVDEAAEYTGPN